jgi:hypothetical protein
VAAFAAAKWDGSGTCETPLPLQLLASTSLAPIPKLASRGCMTMALLRLCGNAAAAVSFASLLLPPPPNSRRPRSMKLHERGTGGAGDDPGPARCGDGAAEAEPDPPGCGGVALLARPGLADNPPEKEEAGEVDRDDGPNCDAQRLRPTLRPGTPMSEWLVG